MGGQRGAEMSNILPGISGTSGALTSPRSLPTMPFYFPFASHAPRLFSHVPNWAQPFLYILKYFLHFIFMYIQFCCRLAVTKVVNISVGKVHEDCTVSLFSCCWALGLFSICIYLWTRLLWIFSSKSFCRPMILSCDLKIYSISSLLLKK